MRAHLFFQGFGSLVLSPLALKHAVGPLFAFRLRRLPLLTLGAKITLLHATFAHYSQIIQENRETAETELSGRVQAVGAFRISPTQIVG